MILGKLSLCDLGVNDIALASLAAGGFNIVFLAGLKKNFADCEGGLYIAQSAGYSITTERASILKTDHSTVGLSIKESGCVIATHPSIHEATVAAYRGSIAQFPAVIKSSPISNRGRI